MNNKTLFLVFLFSYFLIVSCDDNGTPKPASLNEHVDKLFKPYRKGTPGAAIGIIHNGQQSFHLYGNKALGSNEPVDERTLFEIGSITKTFTASLLAKYHLKQMINLEDAIDQHLPASVSLKKFNNKPIKLIHLANHTSRLPRLVDNIDWESETPYVSYSEEKLYDFLNRFSPSDEPGKKLEYSNVGVGLLGHILSLKTQTSYAQLVQLDIFNPLGMERSYVSADLTTMDNVATGYYGKNQYAYWQFHPMHQAAGAIQSSIEDMMKYLKSNMDSENTMLNQAFKLAQTKTFENATHTVGLSWLSKKNNPAIIWHNGGTGGFNSFIGFDPSTGNGVVVLFNTSGPASAEDLGFEILKVLKEYN